MQDRGTRGRAGQNGTVRPTHGLSPDRRTAMPTLSRRTILAGIAATAAAGSARAQAPAPMRIRGTITAVTDTVLTVATRAGPAVAVTLTDPLVVVSLRRVALADITTGTSVGAVARPGPDGALQAIALTVLPPGVRITERQFAWDLGPDTSMNDGPVEAVVESAAGRDLTLSIQGRSVRVRVGADTPMLMPVPATRADLVPGAVVFINATRGADGTPSTARVTVGKDGVVPVI